RVTDRHPVLEVRRGAVPMARAEEAVPAIVQQEASQIQVPLLAGLAVQLHQRCLDLRVAGRGRPLAGAKRRVDVVGEAPRDSQQTVAAGSPAMSDGGLEQMPGAVELVAVPEVDPAPPWLSHRVVRVEVAIRLLGRLNGVDRLLDERLKLRARLPRELQRGR